MYNNNHNLLCSIFVIMQYSFNYSKGNKRLNPLGPKYPDLNSPNLPWTKCMDSVGRIDS